MYCDDAKRCKWTKKPNISPRVKANGYGPLAYVRFCFTNTLLSSCSLQDLANTHPVNDRSLSNDWLQLATDVVHAKEILILSGKVAQKNNSSRLESKLDAWFFGFIAFSNDLHLFKCWAFGYVIGLMAESSVNKEFGCHSSGWQLKWS
ncbi:hypothetical protein TNIN_193671 [Trichonephila inaurata madagascariensis]|uniref:Uncharacterized protein n=1 Tax=Trichonephila inaurata madagascariensis TaxID=2747483 RepID=A0A8X6XIH0_9ARAC|nr:hypothetical protein TNIN_193671 [Trichonephila inaurata madagascariensis]